MKGETVIGSIMVKAGRCVSWTRVTAEEGWAETLLRVLPHVVDGRCTVGLLTYSGEGFQTVMCFDVPGRK